MYGMIILFLYVDCIQAMYFNVSVIDGKCNVQQRQQRTVKAQIPQK